MTQAIHTNGAYTVVKASNGYDVLHARQTASVGLVTDRVSGAFLRTDAESMARAVEICDKWAAGLLKGRR